MAKPDVPPVNLRFNVLAVTVLSPMSATGTSSRGTPCPWGEWKPAKVPQKTPVRLPPPSSDQMKNAPNCSSATANVKDVVVLRTTTAELGSPQAFVVTFQPPKAPRSNWRPAGAAAETVHRTCHVGAWVDCS